MFLKSEEAAFSRFAMILMLCSWAFALTGHIRDLVIFISSNHATNDQVMIFNAKAHRYKGVMLSYEKKTVTAST